MIEADAYRLIELVPELVSTVRAVRRSVIDDVTRTASGEESCHIVATCHTTRSSKVIEFPISADDGKAVKLRRH